MNPWEVIEEALAQRRPRRTLLWLAEQLDVTPQVVSNWKARGVPARRYRDIAAVLGITVDQLEGIDRLPWETAQQRDPEALLPAVAEVASAINELPQAQRDWVLGVVRSTVVAAKTTIRVNPNGVTKKNDQQDSKADNSSVRRRRTA